MGRRRNNMRIISGIGVVVLTLVKILLWVIAKVCFLVLESMKVLLLLFGLLMRIFLVFVKEATP
jgi:hypothetical protein